MMPPRSQSDGLFGLPPVCWLFIAVVMGLTVFGMLMIFSASSINALNSESLNNDATYYLVRQGVYALVGIGAAIVLVCFDYHVWSQQWLPIIWVGTLLLLLLIYTPVAGRDAYGATRWLSLGPVSLQPSEFAKVTLVLMGATLCQEGAEGGLGDLSWILKALALVLMPLVAILFEPDKGTVLIIALTMVIMAYFAGLIPGKWLAAFAGAVVGFIVLIAFASDYSRQRIITLVDPWKDPFDSGYQLIQGFYAFGSGGLFGVGLGMSRQKYAYLPMAHNDFIYAVIGEELGLVGTLAVLAAFCALVWLGYQIARNAPDISGRLIASGSVTLLTIQMLINVCGVLAIIPLSGKPIPFISYGGSSVMASLMLAGLVVSVARASGAPATVYDERRSRFMVHDSDGASLGGLHVLSGGRGTTPDELRARQNLTQGLGGRISTNANGLRRIDLGPSATDRLRTRNDTRGRRG